MKYAAELVINSQHRIEDLIKSGVLTDDMVIHTVIRGHTLTSGWVSIFAISENRPHDITTAIAITNGYRLRDSDMAMYIGRPGFQWSTAVAELVKKSTGFENIRGSQL